MANLFKTFQFSEAEHSNKAAVFNKLAFSTTLVINLVLLGALLLLQNYHERVFAALLLVDLPFLGLLYLNKKGYTKIASVLFTSLLLLIVFTFSWTGGGMHSNSIQLIPVILLLAVVLNGLKSGILSGALSLLASLFLVVADSKGILPLSHVTQSPLLIFIFLILTIALLFIVLFYLVTTLNKTATKMNEELTLRRKIDTNLLESEERFKILSSFSSEGLMIHDNGVVLDVNLAFVRLWGGNNVEDVIGKQGIDLSGFTPESQDTILRHMKSGVNSAYDVELVHLNGTIVSAEVRSENILYKGKKARLVFMQDITNRKKSERALRESEERFKILSSFSSEGLMIHDKGIILDANLAFARMCGSENVADIVGKNGMEVTPFTTESKNIVRTKMQAVAQDAYDVELIHLNGAIIYAEVRAEDILYRGKKVRLVSMLDISKRKESEKKLKESEERFKTLSSLASEGLLIHENGIILDAIQAVVRLWGNSNVDEIIGKNILDVIPFNETSKEIAIHQLQNYSKSIFDLELKHINGSIVSIEAWGEEIQYKGKKARVVFMRDISMRVKAEKALKESKEQYKNLLEAITDYLLVTDLNGNILYANEPFQNITGILPEDYSNPKGIARIHPDDSERVKKELQNLLLSDKNQTEIIENRFIDSNGKEHWLSGIISKTTFNGKNAILTISRDITEKKIIEKELENYWLLLEKTVKERTEELDATNRELQFTNTELINQRAELNESLIKLQAAQRQLIESEKMASLGVLSSGIAHEINNPLNFIHGGALYLETFIKDNLPDKFEKVKTVLAGINTGISRASTIVKSLNQYSRSDTLPFSNCNLNAILDDCLVILHNQYKDRIEVQKFYSDVAYNFEGNEGRLHQAFLNILSNASQAIPAKGKVTITTKVTAKEIAISISDTGEGIPKAIIKKIFDPFFTTKEPGKGTGLGLSITYTIIQEHKGTIKFESQPNEGTKVSIKFPLNFSTNKII